MKGSKKETIADFYLSSKRQFITYIVIKASKRPQLFKTEHNLHLCIQIRERYRLEPKL